MGISSDIDVGEVNQALVEQHLLVKLILRSIVRGVNFLGTAGWGEVNEAIKVGSMWAEPYLDLARLVLDFGLLPRRGPHGVVNSCEQPL